MSMEVHTQNQAPVLLPAFVHEEDPTCPNDDPIAAYFEVAQPLLTVPAGQKRWYPLSITD